ncbi:unnamed protein product, partial [Sphacelaria rigidula]
DARFPPFPRSGDGSAPSPPHRAGFFARFPMCYVIVYQSCPTSTMPKWHPSLHIMETLLVLPEIQILLIFSVRESIYIYTYTHTYTAPLQLDPSDLVCLVELR